MDFDLRIETIFRLMDVVIDGEDIRHWAVTSVGIKAFNVLDRILDTNPVLSDAQLLEMVVDRFRYLVYTENA